MIHASGCSNFAGNLCFLAKRGAAMKAIATQFHQHLLKETQSRREVCSNIFTVLTKLGVALGPTRQRGFESRSQMQWQTRSHVRMRHCCEDRMQPSSPRTLLRDGGASCKKSARHSCTRIRSKTVRYPSSARREGVAMEAKNPSRAKQLVVGNIACCPCGAACRSLTTSNRISGTRSNGARGFSHYAGSKSGPATSDDRRKSRP